MGVNVTTGTNGVSVGVSGTITGSAYTLSDLTTDLQGITKIKKCNIYAQSTEAAALQDIIGSFDATNNGCTFTANTGFRGNGTSAYIDAGIKVSDLNASDFFVGLWVQDWHGITFTNASIVSNYPSTGPGLAGMIVTENAGNVEIQICANQTDYGNDSVIPSEDPSKFLQPVLIIMQRTATHNELWVNNFLQYKVANDVNPSSWEWNLGNFNEIGDSVNLEYTDYSIGASVYGNGSLVESEVINLYTYLNKYLSQ